MKKFLLLTLVVPFFSISQTFKENYDSDAAFLKKLSDEVLLSKSADSNLFYLTKNIGARLAGSPQMVMAENWGKKALEDAGADEVIMQQCMVPHWVRGGKDRAFVSFVNKAGKTQRVEISVLAIGNAVGTGAKGLKAEIFRVKDYEDLEKNKENLKGKIVFYDNPFEDNFVQTFMAYGKNATYRVNGPSRAAKYGAVAVMIRSLSHSSDNHPHTGTLSYDESAPKIPAVAVGLKDVRKIDSLFDAGISLSAEIITNGQMLADTIAHNVIGVLKGSEFPDQILTVGGHLDSWDVGEGAHDDGAGVVQTIEMLRAFKALGFQPKKTIHFVLFANEENGARGGKKYAEEAAVSGKKYVFALESDAGGFTPRGFGFSVPDTSWNKIYTWKKLFEPYGSDQFTRGGGGVDIDPLRSVGTALAGLHPDSQRYFDYHHAANDVFEAVNMRELKLGAISMGGLLYLVDKYGL